MSVSQDAGEIKHKGSDEKNNTISHQDRVLFGTRALTVSDKLIDTIDAALIEGVSSLPRLASRKPLLDLLRQSYIRNCHILEAYMDRNIFSIQSLPPSRRKNIVDAFCSKIDPEIPAPLLDVTNHVKAYSQNDRSQLSNNTKMEPPPSPETISNMEQELIDMRSKLFKLKQRRTQLRLDLEQLFIAERTLSKTNTISSQPATIQETVSKMIKSKEVLQELTDVGTNLVKNLDEKEQSRSDDDDRVAIPKKPKLSREEAYEQDCEIVQGNVTRLQAFLRN